jgi:hypothetical protein
MVKRKFEHLSYGKMEQKPSQYKENTGEELKRWNLCSHGGDYEGYDLLGCNAMQFGENPVFRRNISPTSSG